MQEADERENIMGAENFRAAGDIELPSDSLFKGRREVVIEHNGEYYRLKITRQGKLILNK